MTPPDKNLVETVPVDLGARGYDILVGAGLLADAGRHVAPLLRQPRVIIVSDDHVAPLYLGTLEKSLEKAGIRHQSLVLPHGEKTKDFSFLQKLAEDILSARIERSTALIALGGGVIGDLVGFAASIILRGIDFIQIPTSLVAQVDSSVGGKTGINTRQGKNLVGTFYQPRLVLADTTALNSLPQRELLAGYAETVKYGLIHDAAFFDWLEKNGAALRAGDENLRRHAVVTSCRAKAAIVSEDERESGRRALLNLGHTFGHALEAETGYSDRLLHGEAVAIGMVLAFGLSAHLKLCPPEDESRVRGHLSRAGLPTRLRDVAGMSWTAEKLIDHMQQDKKVKDGKITFVLARGIGRAFLGADVDPAETRAFLAHAIGA